MVSKRLFAEMDSYLIALALSRNVENNEQFTGEFLMRVSLVGRRGLMEAMSSLKQN